MKPLTVTIATALLGAAIGVAVAHVEVGEVETRFAPPVSLDASGPSPGGGTADGQAAGFPLVAVDDEVFEFGAMQRGTKMSHEFLFTNNGDAPLRMEVGPTSCKCTLSDVATGPLAPGASAPVKLEWVAKTPAGRFEQTATVLTNDPRNRRVELRVRGAVVEPTGLSPREFMIGQVSAAESRSESVYLVSYGDEPLEATAELAEGTRNPENYEVAVESVSVDELPLPSATSGVRIDLTVNAGLPIGLLGEWVVVKTNLEDIDEVYVPIVGVVQGDVSIHGRGWSDTMNLLNFGRVQSAAGASTKLLISFKGAEAESARATVGEVDPEWLEVEVGEPRVVREGVVHQPMTVSVPTGRPPEIRSETGQGVGDARVQLLTNRDSTPEIDVRVRFIIAE